MEKPQPTNTVVSHAVDIYVALAVLTLLGYLAVSMLAPFLSILLWAIIMSVGIYPVFLWLVAKTGGRSGLSATLIAVLFLTLLLGPTMLIVESIMRSASDVADFLKAEDLSVPPPKPSVQEIPLIGGWIFETWSSAHNNLKTTLAQYAEEIKSLGGRLLSTAGGLVGGVLQFALSIIFAALFLVYADPLGKVSNTLADRVSGSRGAQFVSMAASTIQNVSRGVLGVALIQGGLGSLGIFVADLPFAGVLSVLLVASTIIQVPPLVIIPLIIYSWTSMDTLGAGLFTAYMLPVLFSDNVLKPILMARGLSTPMVVIFIGVIGGTLSGGLLGLFIGPVILAVVYELILVWIRTAKLGADDEAEPAPATE